MAVAIENETEPRLTQARATILSLVFRYWLLCGGTAVLSGYFALVGTLADEFSKQITRNISVTLAFLAVLALFLGIPAILASGIVERKSQAQLVKAGVRIASDLVVFSCAFVLLLFSYGIFILVLQLSTGQFLFGNEDVQYRHLMILSAYAGTMFGVFAGWKGRTSQGLALGNV